MWTPRTPSTGRPTWSRPPHARISSFSGCRGTEAGLSIAASRVTWVLVALAALVVAFAPSPAGAPPRPAERILRLNASQFSFAPAEVQVNRGDTVVIQLTSTDVVHGLYVDGYGVSVEADPGKTESLTFVADRPGSFRLRCSVTCGALHPFMIGKLTVGSPSTLYRGVGVTVLGALGMLLTLRKSPQGGALG